MCINLFLDLSIYLFYFILFYLFLNLFLIIFIFIFIKPRSEAEGFWYQNRSVNLLHVYVYRAQRNSKCVCLSVRPSVWGRTPPRAKPNLAWLEVMTLGWCSTP